MPHLTLPSDKLIGQNLSAPVDAHTPLSKSFCILPFIHTYIRADGSLSACCESQETTMAPPEEGFASALQNTSYQNLRKALLNGERPELCKKCWKNEEVGLLSNRQEALRIWSEALPSLSENESPRPRFLEIKCNNICNLKCRMCHPSSSFRIGEDQEIISKYRKGLSFQRKPKSSTKRIEDLLQQGPEFFSNLKVIQFSGGEPLLSEEQFKFVEYLSKHGLHSLELRYSTNLTNLDFKSFDYLDLWRPFRKINIKISADGIDDVYDYIRVGASFETLKINFERLLKSRLSSMELAIGFTTQAYNVYQLPEFLDFFEQYLERSRISTHLLYSPELMSLKSLPHSLRDRIANKLQQRRSDLGSLIHFLKSTPEDHGLWTQLNSYTKEMEQKQQIATGFHALMDKYLYGY